MITGERELAEQLVGDYQTAQAKEAEPVKEAEVAKEEVKEAPANEDGKVTKEETKQLDEYAPQWRGKALEMVKELFSNNPDYKDKIGNEKVLEDLAYYQAVNAAQRIKQEVERTKRLQDEYTPFKKYYEDMEKNEYIKALREGKARIVMGDEPAKEEFEQDPVMKKIEALEAQNRKMIEFWENKEKLTRQESEQLEQAKEQERIGKAIDSEEKELMRDYSQFADWIKTFNTTGIRTPEFEEVLSRVQNEGISLKRAVQSYFFEKGLPRIQQETKQKTIESIKLKAKNNTESNSSSTSQGTNVLPRTNDIEQIAQQIIEDAQNTGRYK